MKRNEKTIKLVSIIITVFFAITLISASILAIINVKTIEYKQQTTLNYSFLGTTTTSELVLAEDNKQTTTKNKLQRINSNNVKDVDNILLSFEYYNSKKNIEKENVTLNLSINVYINSILNSNELALIQLNDVTTNRKIDIKTPATKIDENLPYRDINKQVNEYIDAQNKRGKITNGIIEIVLSTPDKDAPKAIVQINLALNNELDSKVNVKNISDINEEYHKSTTFPLLIVVGSIVMVCGGICGYVYGFKSSKLTDYEYSKKVIFKHNKDNLISGNITNDEFNKSTKLSSFDELLKMQSIVSLPIIYQKNDKESYEFLIKANSNYYSFVLNK